MLQAGVAKIRSENPIRFVFWEKGKDPIHFLEKVKSSEIESNLLKISLLVYIDFMWFYALNN